LRAAEARIEELLENAPPDICGNMGDGCFEDRESAPDSYTSQSEEWWNTYSLPYENDLEGVAAQPHFYTELWGDVRDTLSVGSSRPQSGVRYFVNTARAVGGTDTAVVLVESTYAKSY
jgi:Tfp pilus assembly protein PilX